MWRVFYFAAFAVVLASCQTDGSRPPAVSLEEAKKITATFEGTSFLAYPVNAHDRYM